MTAHDTIWTIAIFSMVALYLGGVAFAVRRLWRHRLDCFSCTVRQAWGRSSLLAFVATPSLVGDLWLFAVPGPAALGFAIVAPGVIFSTGFRLELLLMISVLYVLPWIACTALIFYVWRVIRWRRRKGKSSDIAAPCQN